MPIPLYSLVPLVFTGGTNNTSLAFLITSWHLILFKLIFIGLQLFYNVVLVSAVEKSESATRIHISPLLWISFPFRSPQSNEQCSLCYTVGSHQLSILYVVVYICQINLPIHPTPLSPPGIHTSVLYICVSISALQIRPSVLFFQIPHISGIMQYLFFSF